jgi:hypothetical protein
MFSDEAKMVDAATNDLSIIKDNVNYEGFPDPQQLVEHMVELTETCSDKAGALTLYEENLIKSLMRPVLRKYPNLQGAKEKLAIADMAARFTRLVKFEGTARFCLDTSDPQVLPSDEAYQALMNTDAEDHYSIEFAEYRAELSHFAVWFTPGGNNSLTLVVKPQKTKKKKAATAAVPPTKGAKKAKCSEHVEKNYHVEGKLTTRWKSGDWAKMSEEEKMEYRAQRGARGNWPDEIPSCEQWIRSPKGQFFEYV